MRRGKVGLLHKGFKFKKYEVVGYPTTFHLKDKKLDHQYGAIQLIGRLNDVKHKDSFLSLDAKPDSTKAKVRSLLHGHGDWVEMEIREVQETPTHYVFKGIVRIKKGSLTYTLTSVDSSDHEIFNHGEIGEQMFIFMEKVPRTLTLAS